MALRLGVECRACENKCRACENSRTALGGHPKPPAGDEARPPHPLRKGLVREDQNALRIREG